MADPATALRRIVLGGPGRQVRIVGDGRQAGGGPVSIQDMNEPVRVRRQDINGLGVRLGGGLLIDSVG